MAACPTRFEWRHPESGQVHHVVVCAEPQHAHRFVVDDFLQAARTTLKHRGEFHVVLAGGNTPRPAYTLLARKGRELPWERIHVYWSDERMVPPGHSRSNYRMVHQALLQHVPIPPRNIHRIFGEFEPRRAAEAYDILVAKMQCSFDWALLGLGADGHTASLFPNIPRAAPGSRRPRCAVAVYVPKLNEWRVTLTPCALNQARWVRFLVLGEEKAQAVYGTLAGSHRPDRWPAQELHPKEPILWILDQASARLLLPFLAQTGG